MMIDRRKTAEVLWMAFVCARDWKESLIDAFGESDPAVRELKKDIRAIKRLQRKIFGTDKTALDVEIEKAKSVSIFDLRQFVEDDKAER